MNELDVTRLSPLSLSLPQHGIEFAVKQICVCAKSATFKQADEIKKMKRLKRLIRRAMNRKCLIAQSEVEPYADALLQDLMSQGIPFFEVHRPWEHARPAVTKRQKAAKKKGKKQGSKSTKCFYSTEEWLRLRYRVLKAYDARCVCCGATRSANVQLHVDHIKPRSIRPDLELVFENLQILCRDCNLGKSNKDATDWR